MGATGSYTAKATIDPLLYPFTKWVTRDITLFIQRGQNELPETFALRKHEFEHLIGAESLSFTALRALFKEIFDTDNNGLVDKFEVMCIILMTSKVSSLEKVHFFFVMFNFNSKGYLNESELTLLLMAVTRGAFKIDQKFTPPSAKTIKALVAEAFTYSRREVGQLRKPELVDFVQHNVDVSAFLECWRGHASQVLLPPGIKWRDMAFPSHPISIAPSKEWTRIGLPPSEMVHWRRRDKVGTELDSLAYLFLHTESFLKTIDRRPVYKGDGVLGTGYIKQGCLADRWVLNALAAMSSKPPTIFYLFATTGQEDDGRFCTRFFECGSWRSVYIDDRIPCAPNFYPLFSASNSPLEAWPVILEKGLAKYMGSYGHIAAASIRVDSTLSALRYLTGGHVYRVHTGDFVWGSIVNEIETPPERNGLKKMLQYLAEGSLVAFGRSAALAMMTPPNNPKSIPSRHMLPPIGHLFPLVGSTKASESTCFILRDAWGLLQDAHRNVDKTTGFCNTFQIKVEDIPLLYDTIMLVRYPDSFRERAVVNKLKAWNTEILSQPTKSRLEPAAFTLTVERLANGGSRVMSDKKMRRRSSAAEIDMALHAADFLASSGQPHLSGNGYGGVKKLTMEELAPLLRLKDRTDFSRINDKKEAFLKNVGNAPTGAASASSGNAEGEEGASSSAQRKGPLSSNRGASADDDLLDDERVEVCITISSNCEWSVAGAEFLGAELRAKLIPSLDTLKRMRNQIIKSIYQKKVLEIRIHNMRVEENKLLEVQTDNFGNETNGAGQDGQSSVVPGSKRSSFLARTASNDGTTPGVGSTRNSILQLNSQSRSNRNSFINPLDNTAPATLTGGVLTERNDGPTAGGGETSTGTEGGRQETDPSSSSRPAHRASLVNTYKKLSDISWEEIEKESVVVLNQQLQAQFQYSSKRCWESKPLYLVPGQYTLLADVCFAGQTNMHQHHHKKKEKEEQGEGVGGKEEKKEDKAETAFPPPALDGSLSTGAPTLPTMIPYEQVKMMCVPRDIHEAPWLEDALIKKVIRRRHVFHGLHGEGYFSTKGTHKSKSKLTSSGTGLTNSSGGGGGSSGGGGHLSRTGTADTRSEKDLSTSRSSLRRRGTASKLPANSSQQSLDNASTGSQGSMTSLQYLEQKIFPHQHAMAEVAAVDDLPPLDHHIWVEVSSFDRVRIAPLAAETVPFDHTLLYEDEDEEKVQRLNHLATTSGRTPQSMQPFATTNTQAPLEKIVEMDSRLQTMNNTANNTVVLSTEDGGESRVQSIAEGEASSAASDRLLPSRLADLATESLMEESSLEEAENYPKPIVAISHHLDMDVPEATWPFLSETQQEAASAYLLDQMTLQRENAELLATDFIDIASKVNNLKKAAIVSRRTTVRAVK